MNTINTRTETDKLTTAMEAQSREEVARIQQGKPAKTSLNKLYDETAGTWAEASQKTLKSGTPEEQRTFINSHPILSSMTLPSAYKVVKNNWFDSKIGEFKWDNPKDSLKQQQFAKGFLSKFLTELRSKGLYTDRSSTCVGRFRSHAQCCWHGCGDGIY